MGQHARLDGGYIELDADAWLAQRVIGPAETLNQRFEDFSDALTHMIGSRLFPLSNIDRIEAFILARCGQQWAKAKPSSRIQVEIHHAVSLDRGLHLHRFTDPEDGDIVFVTAVRGPYVTGDSLAYREIGLRPENWTDLQAEITCPNGHQYLYGSATVTVDNILRVPVVDAFPHGHLITIDPDPASPTYGRPQIICPRCDARCDVELPRR